MIGMSAFSHVGAMYRRQSNCSQNSRRVRSSAVPVIMAAGLQFRQAWSVGMDALYSLEERWRTPAKAFGTGSTTPAQIRMTPVRGSDE